MKKVLVKSMIGLLGDLENRVCCLHGTGFDEATLTYYAELGLNSRISRELKLGLNEEKSPVLKLGLNSTNSGELKNKHKKI